MAGQRKNRPAVYKQTGKVNRSYNDRRVIGTLHKLPFGMLLIIAIALAGFVGYTFIKDRGDSSAAMLFDGTKVASWPGKQLGSGCGSSLKDVTSVPPGKTGTSVEVTLADGCKWSGDGTADRERAELVVPKEKMTFKEGAVVYFDFYQRFDQLTTSTGSDWDIWFQTHYGSGGQPNIIMTTANGKTMSFKTSLGCSHTSHWSGASIQLGRWYHFTIGTKFSKNAADGWIELKLDGNTVVPRKNIALLTTATSCNGNGNFDGTFSYVKKGIYRNGSLSGNERYTMYGFQVTDSSPVNSAPAPTPTPTPTPTPSPTPISSNAWSSWKYTTNTTVANSTNLTMQFNANYAGYTVGKTDEYCLAVPTTVAAPTSITFNATYNPNGFNTVYFHAGDPAKRLWQVTTTGGTATTKDVTIPLQGQRKLCFGNTINSNYGGNFPTARYLRVNGYSIR